MDQGDIYKVDLALAYGKERFPRSVMIVTLKGFNEISLPFVVSIATPADPEYAARENQMQGRAGFAIPLVGCSKTQGFVLCNQIRTLDFVVRNAKYIESAPLKMVEKVIQKIITFMVKP